MLFTSLHFIILALVTFGLYYLPALRRWQVFSLIVASLTFYAYNQLNLLWLLLLSVTINIVASYYVIYGPTGSQKLVATLGVIGNLAILCFFKYSPLFARTFLSIDAGVGAWLLMLPLPIGISFFTFQGISLVVDTYRNRHVDAYRSLIARNMAKHAETVLFFKAFFPQLVSGPIVKAHDFLPQIKPKYINAVRWEYCFRTLVLGYFLKTVIADNLKDHTYIVTYPYFENLSSLNLIVLLFGYSMQIFADFAGYSLIALGLAALFGYRFPINFNFPYVSSSFSDFWRRWHISLSSFLREYLYIPLGGNRHGKARTYFNLMLTMVLGGLWHGAAWSYAIWGLAHGLALAVERFLTDKGLFLMHSRVARILKGLWVFSFVTLAWLLFKLPNFSHVIAYLRAIAVNTTKPIDSLAIMLILMYAFPVVAYHLHYLLGTRLPAVQLNWARWDYVAYGLLIFMIITNSGSEGTFIYFQF
ncbi:MBOAT family O-acyltransferase [Spirosoma validum]|uniref:MBOAT family protein n=1 Tax=Spirosoma validum TaxID=2771355 RepID=A0A927AXQ7_9BACT|nr:MBOAT family protein [Spirosoma validum]MBD2751776.1 MBOAT family protein [Spirosoma validum]